MYGPFFGNGSNNAIVSLEGTVRGSVGIHYRARMKECSKEQVVMLHWLQVRKLDS
ncbi:hypothetical protein HanRHA438_Chr02g0053471 [Helianthus annuus]|nr:hypothetical protein HanRHA438_Chr02g0053471 [Helianthus annuus]